MGLADNAILTQEQKTLLLHFSESDLRQSFYLTGGTALAAFYLFHRVSEDLDFFSGVQAGIEEILAFLKTLPDRMGEYLDKGESNISRRPHQMSSNL